MAKCKFAFLSPVNVQNPHEFLERAQNGMLVGGTKHKDDAKAMVDELNREFPELRPFAYQRLDPSENPLDDWHVIVDECANRKFQEAQNVTIRLMKKRSLFRNSN